jgi:hypothetical protein
MEEGMFIHVTQDGHFLSKPQCKESDDRENSSQHAWKELYFNYSDIRMVTLKRFRPTDFPTRFS